MGGYVKGMEDRIVKLEDRPQFESRVDPDGGGGTFGIFPDPFSPKKTGVKCDVCGTEKIYPHPNSSCAVIHSKGTRCDWNDPICPNQENHPKTEVK